ncbi:MAG TPA: DUF4397 domain-containing protein [Burkholderiaceae bacterium]|nr:DUF4397 domain-containing protein [Burkholderiaceae bacterium]
MKARQLAWLLAAATVTLLAACGGGGSNDNLDDRLGIADPKLRLVHAVPGGPDVSLWRNGLKDADATGIAYKTASKYYVINEGRTDLQIKTASGDTAVAAAQLDSNRGHRYTLVALPGSSGVDVLAIDDPYQKGLTSEKARVRVANAAVNTQAVDIYLTAPNADLNTAAPQFASVGYKAANPPTGNDSVEFDGGDYQLRVTTAGTKTVIFNAGVTLGKNVDWLLVSIPDAGLAGVLTPNAIRMIVVKADDNAATASQELTSH